MIHDFYYVVYLPVEKLYVVDYVYELSGKYELTNVIWKAKPFESQGDAFDYMSMFERDHTLHIVRGQER